MKIRIKLAIYMIVITLLTGSVAISGMLIVNSYFSQIINTEIPKLNYSGELEINIKEMAKDTLDYFLTQNPNEKDSFKDNTADFEHFLNEITTKLETAETIRALNEIKDDYHEFSFIGKELIKIKDEQNVIIKERRDLLNNEIEVMLDSTLPDIFQNNSDYSKKINILNKIAIFTHELMSAVRGYILKPESFLKDRIKSSIKSMKYWQIEFDKLKLSDHEKENITVLNSMLTQLVVYSNKLTAMEDKKLELLKSFDKYNNKIDTTLDDILQLSINNNIQETQSNVKSVLLLVILSIISVIIIALIIAFIASKKLSTPILKLVQYANAISDGLNPNEKIRVQGNDEITELSKSFQKIVDNNKGIENSASEIGNGNFDTVITLRSQNDSLGSSLIKMKQNLRDLSNKMKEESWLNSNLAETIEFIQTFQKIDVLANTIISRIAELLGAGQGVIYLMKEFNGENYLELTGSYAYVRRKHITNRIKIGEGIVGQCGLERKKIILTNVPEDYIQIKSGLGEHTPTNIAALPIISEDNLLGVLELASFKAFTDIQINLLDEIAKNLGIVFANIQNKNNTENLLIETQKLAEKLQSQQEELKTSNEELEQQTKALQQSEEELKQQSEELRVSNEELEQKTTYLEEQKQKIETQNEEIKVAQKTLEEKANQLEITGKYKSEFLANMSHELRTPLNSMLILAKLFSDNQAGNLNKEQVEQAQIIYKGGQDLLNLINDILDLSKIEAGKLQLINEDVNIDELITSMNEVFKPLAKNKELEFNISKEEGIPVSIKSDFIRIKQVLKNLISNAIKFTDSGSVNVKVFKPELNVAYKNPNLVSENVIAFSIKDTGIGIPLEKQKQIFEAFQQAEGSIHRKYGGTGLGLTISRELIKRLNGELHLQSSEGNGTTFTLYIPESSTFEKIHEPGKKTENIEKKVQKPIHVQKEIKTAFKLPKDDKETLENDDNIVLIIEDDPIFCNILKQLINKKGFKVIFADSGYSGLQLAAEYKPSGIILDLGLPDIDGIGVLNKLKSNLTTRHIPVHIITARDTNNDILKKGAIGYYKKPVTEQQILEAVNKIESLEKKDIKQILVIEDDISTQKAIIALIDNKNIEIHKADTAKSALDKFSDSKLMFDCVILDLNLPDMSGFDLLKEAKNILERKLPPIIIYTGKELSQEEYEELCLYTTSIVIKSAESPERLLDEVTLFLHSVESTLPSHQQKMIRMLHDADNSLNEKKVLLVDDDMRNVYALSAALQSKGIAVTAVTSGKKAEVKLQESNDFDIVLMDIMMPEQDGYETIKNIRKDKQNRNLPIIAITAKAMLGDREKCLSAGANDYLPKPVDIDKLIALLKIWLL